MKPEGIPTCALPAGCWHSGHSANSPAGWCPGKKDRLEFDGEMCPEPLRVTGVNANRIFEGGGSFWGVILEKGCEFVKSKDDFSGVSSQGSC